MSLPNLSLPIFTEKLEGYRNWRDTASILIKDPAYNDRKLIALKDSLRNKPLDLIRNIKNTDGAFLRAWNLIASVCDNQRKLISAEVDKLFSLEIYENIEGLYEDCEKVSSSVSSRKSGGYENCESFQSSKLANLQGLLTFEFIIQNHDGAV